MVEVERADTVLNLWSDFRFVLKKMGFCRAELEIGDELRTFFVPNTAHEEEENLRIGTYEVKGSISMKLTLYAEKGNFSSNQFGLITDIAVEALSQISQKWKEVNQCEFDFGGKAKEARSYRGQNARNLYRPTY